MSEVALTSAIDGSSLPLETESPTDLSGLLSMVAVARQHGIHVTVPQLMRENQIGSEAITTAALLKCCKNAGLEARAVKLNWRQLYDLGKALPAIVTLSHGPRMVLLRVEGDPEAGRVVLQDPLADEDAVLTIDQIRFEDVWTGEALLIKRDYELGDEQQPFGLGLIASLIFRERRMARDVAICAIVLGLLSLAPIVFFRLLIDRVLPYKAFNTFNVLCIGFLVVVFFEATFAWLRRYLVLLLTTRADVKLSTYVFDRLLSLPMDFFERAQVGKVMHDVQQLWKIRNFLIGQLFGTVLDSVTLLIFIPVMFFFSPLLTLVVLAMCALIAVWLVVMLPVYRRKSKAAEAADAQRGAFLVQSLNGIRTVKSLSLEARQKHQWDVHVARVARLRQAEGLTANLMQSMVLPAEALAVYGALALGVYLAMVHNDPVQVGALFAFMILSRRVVSPLMHMAQLVNQYDEARTAVEVVRQLVNQPAEETRSYQGVQSPVRGAVEFSQMTFKYKGASSPALHNVSFEVPPGGRLGIMGRSGSGKTTVTRLLQRLHSDYDGLIKVDGIDVREYDLGHLRHSMGVVLQENFLFSGTIRENIAVGKSDASFEDVVLAARLAGAEEFIDRLPRGYETYIYEGSPNLSGGQRQRLAIARALIVNPPLLILDEATSALDPESEAILNENLARIAHGRTLIMVSHRLASLVSMDAILVLDGGKVVDVGRHGELLQRCEIYRHLWHEQNSHLADATRPAQAGRPSLVS